MSKDIKLDLLVEGGKASTTQQMAQTLGPMGVNIKEVLAKINEITSNFKGMQIPVKLIVNPDTKEYNIEVGTPPVSQLIKKELSLEKGSGVPNKNKVGNLGMEQVIKIAKMKEDSMLVNNLKAGVKNVVGSCNSLGILVEGLPAIEINNKIDSGKFDSIINSGATEISQEKLNKLSIQLQNYQKELEKELAKQEALEEEKEEVKVEVAEEAKEEEKKEEVKVEEKKEEK